MPQNTNNTNSLHATESDEDQQYSRKGKTWTPKELADLGEQIVMEQCILFKDLMGVAHSVVPWVMEDGSVTLEPISTRDWRFGSWIALEVKQKSGARMPDAARKDVIARIQDEAIRPDISICPTYVRVAPDGKDTYIALYDAKNSVIKVTRQGISLCPPVNSPLFIRTQGSAPLPNPIGVTPDLNALRKFLNLPNEQAWVLVVCYILYCLRGKGPFPVLLFTGSAGSSKSTTSRVIRRQIDPRTPEIQSLSRSEHDLAITASNAFLVVIDNLHLIRQDMSDSLCRIANGGGLRVRQLYSDKDEALFDLMRPVVLNGIQSPATQTDLLDRCIHIDLPAVKAENRQTEEAFWSSFNDSYPAIFAGLLDALSKTLDFLPRLSGVSPVRMADFYIFGNAVEYALGWKEGTFHDAILANQQATMADTTADDPLAQSIIDFSRKRLTPDEPVSISPRKLLEELENYVGDKVLKNAKLWPQSAHAFGKRLRPLVPALRAQGVTVEFQHSGTRKIVITKQG